MLHELGLMDSADETRLGLSGWMRMCVPCRAAHVKVGYLVAVAAAGVGVLGVTLDAVLGRATVPSQSLAALSPLARSSGLRLANFSSSCTSPLPAVFAIKCHFSASALSIGVPEP